MPRVQGIEIVESDGSIDSMARVAFQAGWRAACHTLGEIIAGPPELLELIRITGEGAPIPEVGHAPPGSQ